MQKKIVTKISNKYSFLETLSNICSFVKTLLFFRGQRIIRKGIVIRGKKMITWGHNLTSGNYCRIEAFIADSDQSKKIYFGNNIQLNDYVHISAIDSVTIGNDVLMASHVYISDNSHGSYKGNDEDTSPNIPPIKRPYYVAPVNIGARVWLGEGVIVMPGVTIGDGAIIGAHSIVNKDIPANTIAVGSPARIVKKWDDDNNKWIKL